MRGSFNLMVPRARVISTRIVRGSSPARWVAKPEYGGATSTPALFVLARLVKALLIECSAVGRMLLGRAPFGTAREGFVQHITVYSWPEHRNYYDTG